MELFPVYLLFLLVFINRYVVGALFKLTDGVFRSRVLEDYVPTVTVVIPLFNEGEQIYHTVMSLLRQTYPPERLTVMVVDDCSTDDSFEWAQRAARECARVVALRNPHNMGKRRGINHAVRRATSELVVSVDSDVVVHEDAVRELVRHFTGPEVAAVGGRVHVLNADENWLTRMQAVKYWFGYEYLKNVERWFGSVMCLSGCLTAYRRDVLLELEPILEDRNILGVPIKYGEDRFLTRQIVKAGYKTTMTLAAQCWTVAPNSLAKYFNQQLRWRRSNIVDVIGGLGHVWHLHPVVGVHYLGLFAMLFSYPVVIFHSFVTGRFWEGTVLHAAVTALLGVVYWHGMRKAAAEARVHPLWFMAMTVVMPVTYLIATPLAMFTLHSGSWETRGHEASPEVEPEGARAASEPSSHLVALEARVSADLEPDAVVAAVDDAIATVAVPSPPLSSDAPTGRLAA